MKNVEIIAMNTALLIENGTIKPENTINTWLGWKMRGYKVKKGAEHVAAFPIWVKSKQKKQEETEEETEETQKKCRDFNLQTAYWFTNEQVERIEEKE